MDQRWTTMYRNCKLNDFSKFNSEIDFTLMDWSGKKPLGMTTYLIFYVEK